MTLTDYTKTIRWQRSDIASGKNIKKNETILKLNKRELI